ncbi:MAG: helix-turn-helix transcriptional regulator [Rhodoferax sp.]
MAQTTTILVVEAVLSDFGLIKSSLQQAGLCREDHDPDLKWAKSLAQGIAQARQVRPDVILLNTSLTESSGVSTVVAMNAALPTVPIIVLNGVDDDNSAIAALEAGAQDYLIRGQFDYKALARAVRHALVRTKLESRLRLFEVALDSAANGIVITDIKGSIEWANLAFTQMTGYCLEETLGCNPSQLLSSGRHDGEFYRQMWATILSGQVWRGELVNRRKDGTLYDESMAIAPVTSGDGSIRNFVAIKQDITERKAAELLIQKSDQQLELALAGSGLGLWDWHVGSGEFATSARWCAMLGLGQEEMEPNIRSLEKLVHPQDWPQVCAARDAHLSGETRAYESEHRMRHKDGHWVWVLERGKVVVRDTHGAPLRAAGTQLDISDNKRLNQEGAELLRRIETLMREVSKPPALVERERAAESGRSARISARQRQVLELVATGCTSAQIAEKLQISPATVVTHRRDLMAKLDLHTVAELTRYAMQSKRDSH